MSRSARTVPLLVLLAACAIVALGGVGLAETYIWVDEAGRTHLTDDPDAVPEAARPRLVPEGEALSELWSDGLLGTPLEGASDSSRPEDRADRLLRGALADLRRGETARANASLQAILRRDPDRAEAHFVLAILDRRRGRFASAEAHLFTFLASAGDALEPWRRSARRQLDVLAEERRLVGPSAGQGPARWVVAHAPEIRVRYDAELGATSPNFAETVMRYLRDARSDIGDALGVVPVEPTRAVLYGKERYRRTHAGRFSFSTVGFYDGRIHVVSAAHPAGELRALLFHEYTHALFRERTGGDRPYWLNEGLAELSERRSRRAPALTRSEQLKLRARIESDSWIPLRRLAPSFSGLQDEDARVAYLEAAAAADWILERTAPGARARLLERLGEGVRDDDALREATGLDTNGIDAAVRETIASAFPPATALSR